ncbi:hypothetical protein Q7C36_019590 [Tachysurus vachellii]|uniref:Uncharacterized protein n=1 Tax=Tachysurus vachellii TaxID=175792 RepID=A0AA88SAW8_TACVA|nr:hypothetical protein Q7C36_019590 [Tachysurus vachellii]
MKEVEIITLQLSTGSEASPTGSRALTGRAERLHRSDLNVDESGAHQWEKKKVEVQQNLELHYLSSLSLSCIC